MILGAELRSLNIEIAERETNQDADWFAGRLDDAFVMRRASGDYVDRDRYVRELREKPRLEQWTFVEMEGEEFTLTAIVTCVVSVIVAEGVFKDFRNCRMFVRSSPAADWLLLSWANEPV